MKISRKAKVNLLGSLTLAIASLIAFLTFHLTAQPALSLYPSPTPPVAQATGTEPFWSVVVTMKGITYKIPESKPIVFPYSKPIQAQGRPKDRTFVYKLQKGQQQGFVTFQKNKCNDGMSDREYEYTTVLYLNGTVKAGCGIGSMLGIAAQ